MHTAIAAALIATTGFALGDTFTAILARRVNAQASMLLLTTIKLLLYVPFIIAWRHEFASLNETALAWSIPLGVVFAAAYLGFIKALEVGHAALVGVIAGSFPAVAAVVVIVFLGQRPSAETIMLLLAVLVGVTLIGLPLKIRESFKSVDKGTLLAFVPMVCWGVFGAFIKKPIQAVNTPHNWFVVQAIVAAVVVLIVCITYNRGIPGHIRHTHKKRAWKYALIAGAIIGTAEAAQALALGRGSTVIIETLLGSYPAVYFLIAHKLFDEPLYKRQWAGIVLTAAAIILLSASGLSS
jgi:drug/metabolite transporter (DMT)-like permease